MREAGNGRGAIKDQEAFGFGSFRQMSKDADAPSVTVSEELQEDVDSLACLVQVTLHSMPGLGNKKYFTCLCSWSFCLK